MKMSKRAPHLLVAAATTVLAFLALDGCDAGRRFTKANVDQVQEGMAFKQVESILGQPDSVDNIVARKTIYTYKQDKDQVVIVFRDGKVQTIDSSLKD